MSVLIKNLEAKAADPSRVSYDDISAEYSKITLTLNESDRNKLSLSILLDLYRNLQNTKWKEGVNAESLSLFILKCCANIKYASELEKKRFLVSLGNLHRFILQQDISTDLALKLSTPVLNATSAENETQFGQLYWVVLSDKILFLEKSGSRLSVEEKNRLIVSDALKVFHSSDLVPFCETKLLWLLNKILSMFGDVCETLHASYKAIFLSLLNHVQLTSNGTSGTDAIYKSLFRCFTLITDGACRHDFKKCALIYAVKFATSLLSNDDLIQPLTNLPIILVHYSIVPNVSPKVLKKITTHLKKLSGDLIRVAVPNLCTILCSHISHITKPNDINIFKEKISADFLIQYIDILQFFIEGLNGCDQTSICKSCPLTSGLHNAALIWKPSRSLLSTFVNTYSAAASQQKIVRFIATFLAINMSLKRLGCVNWHRHLNTQATDLQNDTIVFCKHRQDELSRNILSAVLSVELQAYRDPRCDMKPQHFTGKFHNLALCELSLKNYSAGLLCAFAGAICGDKVCYSIVVKIKHQAKSLIKSSDSSPNTTEKEVTELQMTSVLDAAIQLCNGRQFQNLKAVISDIGEFSSLLLSEVRAYCDQWGSTNPLAGICRGFLSIIRWSSGTGEGQPDWLLIPIPLEAALGGGTALVLLANTTCSCGRPEFEELADGVIDCLQSRISQISEKDSWQRFRASMILASCLFLKSEFKITTARSKMQSVTLPADSSEESEEVLPSGVTIEDEGRALKEAMQAVEWWLNAERVLKDEQGYSLSIPKDSCKLIDSCLNLLLANFGLLRTHNVLSDAIKLAYVAARIGIVLKNRAAILTSVGYLARKSHKSSKELDEFLLEADSITSDLLETAISQDKGDYKECSLALCYLFDLAIYKKNLGQIQDGATILKSVQNIIAFKVERDPDFIEKIGVVYPLLLGVQAKFYSSSSQNADNGITLLTAHANAYREINVVKRNLVIPPRSYEAYQSFFTTLSMGEGLVDVAVAQSLIRRARLAAMTTMRSALRSMVNARAVSHCIRIARTSAECDRTDDCEVQLESIRRALRLPNSEVSPLDSPDCIDSIADRFAATCSVTVVTKPIKLPEIILRAASVQKKTSTVAAPSPYIECSCCLCSDPARLLIKLEYTSVLAMLSFKIGDFDKAITLFEQCDILYDAVKEAHDFLKNELLKISPVCANAFEEAAEDVLTKVHIDYNVGLCRLNIALNRLEDANKIALKILKHSRGDVFQKQTVAELVSTIVYVSKNQTKPKAPHAACEQFKTPSKKPSHLCVGAPSEYFVTPLDSNKKSHHTLKRSTSPGKLMLEDITSQPKTASVPPKRPVRKAAVKLTPDSDGKTERPLRSKRR